MRWINREGAVQPPIFNERRSVCGGAQRRAFTLPVKPLFSFSAALRSFLVAFAWNAAFWISQVPM